MADGRLVIGASMKNENILWATKFFAVDPIVFLEADNKKVIVVMPLELGRACQEAKVDRVLSDPELKENKKSERISYNKQALFLLREYGLSSVAVEPNFPAQIYQFLSENGIQVTFQDPLFPERAVKTEDELEDIMYAQKSMEEVFPLLVTRLADAKIKDGKLWEGSEHLTSEMLRTMFDVELMKRDCMCDVTIIASGNQAADPHCFGFGPIRANTPIVCDMFPRSRRKWCWSDMTRTVVKGKLAPQARRMYDAVYEAQTEAVEMVKPGIDGNDIHNFVKTKLEKLGFQTQQVNGKWQGFFHGTGHGVGLEIHEPPRISTVKGQILQEGNVITIEPGLYYESIGGVRIEDTVYVTKNGYKNLASLSKELLELP